MIHGNRMVWDPTGWSGEELQSYDRFTSSILMVKKFSSRLFGMDVSSRA